MALEMDNLIKNHYPLNECSVFVLGVYFSVSSLSLLFSIFHMHTFRCVQPKVEEDDDGKKTPMLYTHIQIENKQAFNGLCVHVQVNLVK